VINKALAEENPDKRAGFANAVAYYMKLAYSNWHKEMVHDDAIQSELTNLTNGQLEFTNTPFVKSFTQENNNNRQRDGRDNRGNSFGDYRNNRKQKFQQRNNNNNNRNNDRNNDRGGNKFKKKRY
jgi:hypothetical protein